MSYYSEDINLNCGDPTLNLSDLNVGQGIVLRSHRNYGASNYDNDAECEMNIEVKENKAFCSMRK